MGSWIFSNPLNFIPYIVAFFLTAVSAKILRKKFKIKTVVKSTNSILQKKNTSWIEKYNERKNERSESQSIKCPYSKEESFMIEAAEVDPSPLELFDNWEEKGYPLAARWLAAGISGQDTPGRLKTGLRRLRDGRFFLLEEKTRIKEELLMKKKALDDPARFPIVFQALPSSLEAQKECLELFMDYLPLRYPDLYRLTDGVLYVQPLDTSFVLSEWTDRPLELCERIVQEDLILLREVVDREEYQAIESVAESRLSSVRGQLGNPPDRPPDLPITSPGSGYHVMTAAAVVFSFSALAEKLGQPVDAIHSPVPGFEAHLRRTMQRTFSLLQPDQPLWRNNWVVAPSGQLDQPLYGTAEQNQARILEADLSLEAIRQKHIKVS